MREAEYILNNDISSSPFDHLYWGVRIYTANWALSGNTEAEKRCAVEKLYSLLPETDELLIPASLFVFDNHSKRVMSGGVRMADNRCHQIFQNAAMVFIRLGKIDYADAFLKKYLYLLREANVSAKYGNDFAKLKREPNALPSTKKIIDEILASEKSDWQTQ